MKFYIDFSLARIMPYHLAFSPLGCPRNWTSFATNDEPSCFARIIVVDL